MASSSVRIGFTFEKQPQQLRAPAPPPGMAVAPPSSSPPSSSSSSSHSPSSLHSASAAALPQPSAHSAKSPRVHQHDDVRSYFSAFPKMVCCCLCCPMFKCALWLCALELVVSAAVWYNVLNLLVQTANDLQIKDLVLMFVLSFWLVTLFTSSGMLIAAQRRKNASFVLPRLIQQIGLLIMGLLGAAALFFYFSGGKRIINGWIISIYRVFLGEEITKDDEKAMQHELHYVALVLILIDILFIGYMSFGLCVTRKYYNDIRRQFGSGFTPVSQNEPSAPPQPPTNPHFKGV